MKDIFVVFLAPVVWVIYRIFSFDPIILVHWFTLIGIGGGLIGTYYAINTYRNNNLLKKWELIKEIFDAFMKDEELYKFYDRIKDGEEIDFENKPNDERLLNKSLTMFDSLCYFKINGFLDKKIDGTAWAWEYVASEIHNFALNNSVWKYINKIKDQYNIKGFPNDIIPFTGFPELVKTLLFETSDNFKAKCPQELDELFKMLPPDEQMSYYKKVTDIPEKIDNFELTEFKHLAAIVIFARKKIKMSHENGHG